MASSPPPPPPPMSPPQPMVSSPLPPPPNSPPMPVFSVRDSASPSCDSSSFPPPPPFPPLPPLPTLSLSREASDTSSTSGKSQRTTIQKRPAHAHAYRRNGLLDGEQSGDGNIDGTSSSFSSPLPPCPEDPPAPEPLLGTPPQYQPQYVADDGNTDDLEDEDRRSTSTLQDQQSSIEQRDDESADGDTEDMDMDDDDATPLAATLPSPPPPPPSPPTAARGSTGTGTPPPPPSGAPGIKSTTSISDDSAKRRQHSQESRSSTAHAAPPSSITSMRTAASLREILAADFVSETPVEKSRFYIGDIESYSIIDKVGSGTYGEVFKCMHKVTKEVVALKKLRADVEKNGFPVTSIREMKILKHLRHPNIVALKEIVSTSTPPREGKRPPLYFSFEYLEHDLSGLLNHSRVKFSRTQIQCYMRQLLCGVAFMHRNKIVHRDIKASNLLLNNQGMLKIADFGLSRFWNDVVAKAGKYTNKVVTLWYRSPELLLGSTSYDYSVDVWSVGLIFAELLTGRPLLQGKAEVDQLQLIFGLVGSPTEENWPDFKKLPGAKDIALDDKSVGNLRQRFSNISPHAVDLLEKLLTLDPAKRITAAEAMDHDYFWRVATCKPRDLPKFGVSSTHEYQSKKRHREDMQAAAAVTANQQVDRNVRPRDRNYRGDSHHHRSHASSHHHQGAPQAAHAHGSSKSDRDRPHHHQRDPRDRERSRSRERDERHHHRGTRHEH